MLCLIRLTRDVSLHPEYLGPDLERSIRKILISECEGSSIGAQGVCVAVGSIDHIGYGRIVSWTAHVQFSVKFEAVVFRPLRNEIVDAIVHNITKLGIFSTVGPIQCFVTINSLPREYRFECDSEGTCGKIKGGPQIIAKNHTVRLRIQGYRTEGTDFFAAAVLFDDDQIIH